MNTEEAIAWFERCKPGTVRPGARAAYEKAIDALRAQQERENPKPLTLEELPGMLGVPVWIQPPGMPEHGRWAIADGVNIEGKALYLLEDYTCHDYGKVWIAYRHKPKEETKC